VPERKPPISRSLVPHMKLIRKVKLLSHALFSI
jgi:hypothetical protein